MSGLDYVGNVVLCLFGTLLDRPVEPLLFGVYR